jgi:glycosyltransferase involved in cell wall biosynthesis
MRGVSFIVPAYNEEALIGPCLYSIIVEAARRGDQAEVIVVDNGSTDRTCLTVMRAMLLDTWGVSIRLVHEYRKGVVHARQRGARFARYDLIACVDADNVIPCGWLDAVLGSMSDPSVVAVSGPAIYDELGPIVRALSWAFYGVARVAHNLVGPMVQGGNYVVRRTALEQAGGYDLGYEFFGEDTATAQRLAKVGRVVLVPEMWCHFSGRRMTAHGLVRTTARYVMNYLWVTFLGRPLTRSYTDVRS